MLLKSFNLCFRDWERIVQESSLFRVLQEVVEEETIERESSNPTSEDPTSGVSPQTTDLGKAIHHAILTVNTLKSSDVCVLSLFSLMVSLFLLLLSALSNLFVVHSQDILEAFCVFESE